MTTSEESAERAPHTDQEQGEQSGEAGRKRRRRRRGRNRDKGEGAPQDQAEGQVSDDDGDDDGPDTDAGDGGPASADDAAGNDPERKKKRRRKKKKRGEGGDEQSAEQDGTAAPAGDATPQQPSAPQEKQEKQGRGRRDRDRRGNDRGEQPERSEKKEPPSRGNALQRRMSRIEPVIKDVYDDDPVIPAAPTPPATTVEGYVSNHRGWQREVLMKLRDIVRTCAPALEESIKWSQPVFEGNGPVCYMKAFSDHVNFGFWRGTELDDPEHLLVGDGIKMRHVKISQVNDVRRELFESFVRQAVRLNIEKGDPTLS